MKFVGKGVEERSMRLVGMGVVSMGRAGRLGDGVIGKMRRWGRTSVGDSSVGRFWMKILSLGYRV